MINRTARVQGGRILKGACPRDFSSAVQLSDIECSADDPEVATKAAHMFNEFGCCVVRGLTKRYVQGIKHQVESVVEKSIELERKGLSAKIDEGWLTLDGTLFIPAAWDGTDYAKNRNRSVVQQMQAGGGTEVSQADIDTLPPSALHSNGKVRDKQIMVLGGLDYHTSSHLFRCACDPTTLDIVEAVFGHSNIELFGNGQLVYKEPAGGHLVSMHQDGAFFEFEGVGPVGTLSYCIDTDGELNNGPLLVFPRSHKSGYIPHQDTSSHLGLLDEKFKADQKDCIRIDGNAGDTIIFHQFLVHGSPPNHSTAPRPTFINR
jgi:hypothetical protein